MGQRINYDDYKTIQRLKRQGCNRTQAHRKSKIRLVTVRVYWNMSEEEYFELSQDKACAVEKYREFLTEHIKVTPAIQDSVLLQKIHEEFDDNSITRSTFYRYTNKLREQLGFERKSFRKYMMVVNDNPGEFMQADGGEYNLIDMYGNKQKIYFIAFVLTYSRMKFAYFQSTPFNTRDMIKAHECAFKYYNGRAKVIMYDQAKVVVYNETAGNVILSKEFEEYVKHHGFIVHVCKKYDPSTKGQVESTVKIIKMSFLQNREYAGVNALNSQAIYWFDLIGNAELNSTTLKSPQEMFEVEKSHLLKTKPYKCNYERIVSIDECSSAVYKCNRYVLPADKVSLQEKVLAKESGGKLHFFKIGTNELLATYDYQKSRGELFSNQKYLNSTLSRDRLLTMLNNDERILKFIDGVSQKKSRFMHDQCVLLRRIYETITLNEFYESIEYCNKYQKFCATEVLTYITMQYGFEKVSRMARKGTKANIQKRAEALRIELYGDKDYAND